MSRYVRDLPNGNKLIYGYDAMLSEYFIEEWLPYNPKKDDFDQIIFSVGTCYNTTKEHQSYPGKMTFSNGELLEIFMQYKEVIPQEHIDALVLDLPF